MPRNPVLTGSSRRRRRGGLKSWQTRQNYALDVCAAVAAIATMPPPVYSTIDWEIKAELLNGAGVFYWDVSRFYAHMSEWTRRDIQQPAFSLLPGFGLHDACLDILASGAVVFTAKAKFQLIKGK